MGVRVCISVGKGFECGLMDQWGCWELLVPVDIRVVRVDGEG